MKMANSRNPVFIGATTRACSALICAPLEEAGFANGFSTRLGGTSAMPADALNLAGFNEDSAENILENRRRFLKLFPNGTETGPSQAAGRFMAPTLVL